MALQNWMARISDDTRLSQVTFPATHDSGMSRGSAQFKTQDVEVHMQLKYGARQLDLRIVKVDEVYQAYHGSSPLIEYGETWDSITNGVVSFMAEFPTEVLILKMDKQKPKDFLLIKELNDKLKRANVPAPAAGGWLNGARYIDTMTMRSLRGRILICSKEDNLTTWVEKCEPIHAAIQFCVWRKKEKEPYTVKEEVGISNEYPHYILLGQSDGEYSNILYHRHILQKQESMRDIFKRTWRGYGLRGIWFNTFYWTECIRDKSIEVWNEDNKWRRDALWINDPNNRQNVASLDFIDEERGTYIVMKNPNYHME